MTTHKKCRGVDSAPQNPPVWDFAQSLDAEKLLCTSLKRKALMYLWSPQTGSDLTAAWRRDASMPPSSHKIDMRVDLWPARAQRYNTCGVSGDTNSAATKSSLARH